MPLDGVHAAGQRIRQPHLELLLVPGTDREDETGHAATLRSKTCTFDSVGATGSLNLSRIRAGERATVASTAGLEAISKAGPPRRVEQREEEPGDQRHQGDGDADAPRQIGGEP